MYNLLYGLDVFKFRSKMYISLQFATACVPHLKKKNVIIIVFKEYETFDYTYVQHVSSCNI